MRIAAAASTLNASGDDGKLAEGVRLEAEELMCLPAPAKTAWVMHQTVLTPEVIRMLSQDPNKGVRQALLSSRRIPATMIEELYNSAFDEDDQIWLATDPDAPPHLLGAAPRNRDAESSLIKYMKYRGITGNESYFRELYDIVIRRSFGDPRPLDEVVSEAEEAVGCG